MKRFDASKGPRIVGPADGKFVDLASCGVRFMVWAEESGGGFSGTPAIHGVEYSRSSRQVALSTTLVVLDLASGVSPADANRACECHGRGPGNIRRVTRNGAELRELPRDRNRGRAKPDLRRSAHPAGRCGGSAAQHAGCAVRARKLEIGEFRLSCCGGISSGRLLSADSLSEGEPRPSAVPLVPHPRVAIVSDDLASLTPWSPHGIEVRGPAGLQDEGGGPLP